MTIEQRVAALEKQLANQQHKELDRAKYILLPVSADDEIKITDFMNRWNTKNPDNEPMTIQTAAYMMFIDGLYIREDKHSELYK